MPQLKSKKILLYVFLFLLIGTFNNKDLNDLKFVKIKSISVIGLNDKDNLIKTLKSIQYSPDIEIIIQDGKSSYDIIKV